MKKNNVFENKILIPFLVAILVKCYYSASKLFFWQLYDTTLSIVTDCISIVLLIIGCYFSVYVFRLIKSGDKGVRRATILAFVFYAIVISQLLITWPGTWSWDDVFNLNFVASHGLYPWQHILSGIIQMIFVNILPFPAGVIIIQNIINAICVGYCIYTIERKFPVQSIWSDKVGWSAALFELFCSGIEVVVFLMPPILFYQLSGFRVGLCMYLELAIMCKLWNLISRKDEDLYSVKIIILYIFISVIAICWRSENFAYIPWVIGVPIWKSISAIKNKHINRTYAKKLLRRTIVTVFLIVVGVVATTKIQNHMLGDSDYELVSLMGPVSAVVRASDDVDDAKSLQDMGRVVDIEGIKSTSLTGEELYWQEYWYEYTSEEYDKFFEGFIELAKKYPFAIVAERWDVLCGASGLKGVENCVAIERAQNIYSGGAHIDFDSAYLDELIHVELRNTWIRWISMGEGKNFLYYVFWNAFIPVAILVVTWIYMLLSRKWKMFAFISCIAFKYAVVATTEPAMYIMYHLSFYMMGYIALVCIIFKLLLNMCQLKNSKRLLELGK